MLIGVKDGRPSACAATPDHPVNRGKLCPKGLSEHDTLDARQPRALSAAAQQRTARRVSAGTKRIETMVDAVPRRAGAARPGRPRRRSAPASLSRKSSTRSASSCSSASAPATTTATRRCAWRARSPATSARSAATALPGAYEDLEKADVDPPDRRQHRRQPSDSLPAPRSQPGTTLIVADPRVTKTAMMADLHLPVKPRSDLALINGIASTS